MATLIVVVQDKTTQKPLPWVSVELVNGGTTATDTQGRATFNVAPNTPIYLKIRTQTYRPWTTSPTDSDPQKHPFTVPPQGGQVVVKMERGVL